MSETNKLNQKQQAQLQNIFNMNKGVMKCQVDGHEQQRLKYLCLDQSCTLPNKLGCADCFLDSHNGHQRTNVEGFLNKLKERFQENYQHLTKIQDESTLVQFKQDLNLDIDRQFDDIKTQILQKFDSFKVDLKSHLNKKLSIKSESLSQLDQTLNNLKSLSESNFEQFSDTEVNQCIQFYFNNEEIKKGLEENQFLVTKVKQTAIKNKSKYFEKLKNLWADILSEHSDGQNQQNGDESSEDNQNGTPNSQQITSSQKKKNQKKKVQFATENNITHIIESPNKESIQNNNIFNGNNQNILFEKKFQFPRKKVKIQNSGNLIEQALNQQQNNSSKTENNSIVQSSLFEPQSSKV